jgi:hypothetical protein
MPVAVVAPTEVLAVSTSTRFSTLGDAGSCCGGLQDDQRWRPRPARAARE